MERPVGSGIFSSMPDPAAQTPATDLAPRRPALRWRLTLASLRRLPQGALSRLFGAVADVPLPRWARGVVLGGFSRLVGVSVGEAEGTFADYPSLNAFFVRRLRRGLRSWPDSDAALASPVDGIVGQCGTIHGDTLVQAKGLTYTAGELLGSADEARAFQGGLFITIYLSPRHYHRIHAPLPGSVVRARHLPGALMPVNEPSVGSIPRLFATNERLLAETTTAVGRVAVVAVGAYNVGRISAAFDPAWSGRDGGWITNRADPPPPERRYDPGLPLGKGAELMAFHLGSTVVLLTEPGLELVPGLDPGRPVSLGEVLAQPTSRS